MVKKKLSSKQLLAEIAGWYGAIAILSAYALMSFKVIPADGFVFQILNLTGAIGFIIIGTYKNVKQTIILNVFWGVVALIAIINIFLI